MNINKEIAKECVDLSNDIIHHRYIDKQITKIDNCLLINGNCLEVMDKMIEQGIKVDAIITDLPYGITNCKWDSVIPFKDMWNRLNQLIKVNSVLVLFGNEPFSSALRMSNIKNYKYDWIWQKTKPSGHLNAKKQPMRKTENISVFYQKQCCYNPQGLEYGEFNNNRPSRENKIKGEYTFGIEKNFGISNAKNYPNNILSFPNPNNNLYHQTQKPIELMEYLVKTYTNENELVLDFTAGSFSTGIACQNTNRRFIGIELEEKYYNIGIDRITNNRKKEEDND